MNEPIHKTEAIGSDPICKPPVPGELRRLPPRKTSGTYSHLIFADFPMRPNAGYGPMGYTHVGTGDYATGAYVVTGIPTPPDFDFCDEFMDEQMREWGMYVPPRIAKSTGLDTDDDFSDDCPWG